MNDLSLKPLGNPSSLRFFYAVTTTSVYRAVMSGPLGRPYLIKIACRGESSVLVGGKIANGTMVSIGKHLILFVPEGSGGVSPTSTMQREISKVNIRYWGDQTSGVVALFTTEEDAMDCYEGKNLIICDPRWKQKTIEVLRAVGENNLHCSVTNDPEMQLMPKEDWH